MIKVDDCLVSEDVIEKAFACNVLACKGVCCIEGDAGAPLDPDEIGIIEKNLDAIKPEMDQTGLELIAKEGFSEKDPFDMMDVTTCKENKECVFVVRKDGILNCAIEIANKKNDFEFKGIVIAEIKQEKFTPQCDFNLILKSEKIYPQGFSKYCMSIAMLYKNLKANRFKPRLLMLNKILKK